MSGGIGGIARISAADRALMMAGEVDESGEKSTVMIDATYLKGRCTAASMAVKKGRAWPPDPSYIRWNYYQVSRRLRQQMLNN